MTQEELVKRINTLSQKAKTTGLTAEETSEQQGLRKLYIDKFRNNLQSQLENIKFIDENEEKNNDRK